MAAARAAFEEFLQEIDLAEPKSPVIANVTGRPYEPGAMRRTMGEQLVAPVRWTDSIRHLLALDDALDSEEIGGKDLTRMVEIIHKTGIPA
jgi:trans-AT polyketide synthase/acyltransferase/oxidoreductase domain-containing protein